MSFFILAWLGKPAWVWFSFLGVVLALLILDLSILGKKAVQMDVRQSIWLSAGYIAVALIYGGWVWLTLDSESGLAFYTGFALEKTLALDNIFVISLIFGYFAIPVAIQRRVLLWGILGVIVLRAVMIALGTALVSNFEWVLWIFGAFDTAGLLRRLPKTATFRRQIRSQWLESTHTYE